jgi:hypothetical protein
MLATPATPTDTTTIEDDIALLGFKVAVAGTMAKYNLVDQTEDAFMDATGIDASASTGEVRNAANYYSGATAAPTGGTITTYTDSGTDYTVHTFLSSSSFVASGSSSADILVVAGGAGGGGTPIAGSSGGGGGGAGGLVTFASQSVSTGTHAVTVGLGGAEREGAHSQGGNGEDSRFGTLTNIIGGGGGGSADSGAYAALSGGSGGGAGNNSGTGTAGTGTAGQGNAGGAVGTTTPNYPAGGGGGKGAVGGAGSGGTTAGAGGVGLQNNYRTNSNVYYAGGGGGSTYNGGTAGAGGSGGGGAGRNGNSGAATNGTANSGGGGGGNSKNQVCGNGGSGIVVVRFVTGSFNPSSDMTLQSNSTTAEAAPTKGDIVMTYTNGLGTATLNTDLTAEFSADNGSTWTSTTLVAQGSTGTHLIVSAHDVTRTSTSGTSMVYRIKTLNQGAAKDTRIQAVSLGWS